MENQTQQQPTPVAGKWKRIIGIIIGVAIFWLASEAVQHIFFQSPTLNKTMALAASEINKNCPMMVDQNTRLDNTVALPNDSFQYNYTLVNVTKTEINFDTIKKHLEPFLINNVKTNPDLKAFRDNKISIVYNYKDKNGSFVQKVIITPDMYQ